MHINIIISIFTYIIFNNITLVMRSLNMSLFDYYDILLLNINLLILILLTVLIKMVL